MRMLDDDGNLSEEVMKTDMGLWNDGGDHAESIGGFGKFMKRKTDGSP